MRLYHQQKGILATKKKLDLLSNKFKQVGVDADGLEHELDGTEIPEQQYLAEQKALQEQQTIQEKTIRKQKADGLRQNLSQIKTDLEEKEYAAKIKEQEMAVYLAEIRRLNDSINNIKLEPKDISTDIIKSLKSLSTDITSALKKETDKIDYKVDLEPIIKAIKAIKIPEVKIPEYPKFPKIPQPKDIDLTPVIQAIEKIKSFEIPEWMITKDNRLKVEVDRTGTGGGGGGMSSTDSAYLKTIAENTTTMAQNAIVMMYDPDYGTYLIVNNH